MKVYRHVWELVLGVTQNNLYLAIHIHDISQPTLYLWLATLPHGEGGGGATVREGGHVKFYPYENGGGGEGGKSFYEVA